MHSPLPLYNYILPSFRPVGGTFATYMPPRYHIGRIPRTQSNLRTINVPLVGPGRL
jgi:hypothetical protein